MRSSNSRLVLTLALAALCLAALPACGGARRKPGIPPPAAAGAPALEAMSSQEVVRLMGLGWNLGNTLEACGDWIKGQDPLAFETAWGNPETTKAIIDKIRDAGFKSVRIPVAWSNLMYGNNRIEPELMKRVQQIVDWCLEDGLIVVVNIHWDGGWWAKFPTEPEKSMKRFTAYWTQISEHFRAYPASLIFESLNEEGCFGDVWNRYGGPDAAKQEKAYGILNHINQTFVDLIRASGGMNAKRHLLIAGYCTDIDLTVSPYFKMPKDPENHCIVSVHYYTPYTFAGLEKDESWGKMRSTWGTAEDLAELDGNVRKIKERFIDAGVPVIVGEYGATTKNKDPNSVRKYILTCAEKFYKAGACPMLWDATSGHFDRRLLEFRDPDLAAGFKKLAETTPQDSGAVDRK